MLKLVIDFELLLDFLKREPDIFDTDKEFRNTWNSLWNFIESGSDLTIINVPKEINHFGIRCITKLTQGRGKAKINIEHNFKKPHKNKFDIDQNFQCIYFLDVPSKSDQKKYVTNNNFPIAFKENYFSLFEKLVFTNESKIKTIRQGEIMERTWRELLNKYIYYLTDVILVDNYILDDNSILEPNLISLITYLYSIQNNLNLTIITFNGARNEKDLIKTQELIRNKLKAKNCRDTFNLIFFNREMKEHDRQIFTNFIRIKSGDSFNYFNSSGQLITKGTELDFYSYANEDNWISSKKILKILQSKVNGTSERSKHIKINNRLLETKTTN